MEQTLRARCFQQRNLVDYIPWDSLSPTMLAQKVTHLLEEPSAYQRAMSGFKMTAFDVMLARIRNFRNLDNDPQPKACAGDGP
jgi:predicted glycosyltransferase